MHRPFNNPPAMRAARPVDGPATTRIPAEDLAIGDQVVTCGLILDVRTISRVAIDQVEVGWTAGDDHLMTTVLPNDLLRSVVVPRPVDGAGVDRFGTELAGAA